MRIDLRARFVLRISIAMLLLSLFWGETVYFLQTRQIRKELMAQGSKTTRDLFADETLRFEKSNRHGFERLIARLDQTPSIFNIVMLDAYNAERESVFRYLNKHEAEAVRRRANLSPDLLFSEKPYDELTEVNNRIYLQTSGTLYSADAPRGFYEAMVQIDPEWARILRRGRRMALLITVGTIATLGLALYPLLATSYRRLQQTGRKLLLSNLYTLLVLGRAIAERDNDTELHNFRVTYYSIRLAEHLKMSPDSIRILMKGSLLHDVGKIGVRDDVLLKPGPLSEVEFAAMQLHVESGVQIIKDIPFLEDSRDVIQFHHEKFDGSGYPSGLKGEQIPKAARIFSVIDVFDALASKRPYKPAFPYEEVIETMKRHATQFDPQVLRGFLEISREIYSEAQSMSAGQVEERLRAKTREYFNIR